MLSGHLSCFDAGKNWATQVCIPRSRREDRSVQFLLWLMAEPQIERGVLGYRASDKRRKDLATLCGHRKHPSLIFEPRSRVWGAFSLFNRLMYKVYNEDRGTRGLIGEAAAAK